jgi:hypothetical protein
MSTKYVSLDVTQPRSSTGGKFAFLYLRSRADGEEISPVTGVALLSYM